MFLDSEWKTSAQFLLVWFPHGDVLSSPPLELLGKSIKAVKRVAFRLNRCGFQGERAWRDRRAAFGPEPADKDFNYP